MEEGSDMMEQNLQASLEKQIRKRNRKKVWKKIVSVLGSIVVFCTTYALILPAITMTETAYCGLEEHKHGENCYQSNLICEHVEEIVELHTHNENCYTLEKVLECSLVETDGHIHDENCKEMVHSLNCGLEETEAHIHNEQCSVQESGTVCELEETEGHTHTDECWSETENIICGIEEAEAHVHTEECWTELETLVCELPIEVSEEEIHIHDETCSEEIFSCEINEHTHDLACFSNPEADVETEEDWEKTLPSELTGIWSEDVLSIAESQLGYEESIQNYIVTEEEPIKGYTRYGDWYGDKYGHWCAMFVSFCLDYAGVEEFPLDCNCQNWIETLSEEEYGLYREADMYVPGAGDLIFFDWDSVEEGKERRADHIGLVVEVIPATDETPAQIKTIEGNSSDRVTYVTYDLEDESILGYGQLPEQPAQVVVNEGADYTVKVTYGADARIPEGAELVVNEIAADSEEYKIYYEQAVEAMVKEKGLENADELNVSFARFFDIHFLVNGEIIEPTAAVNIEITYKEGAELQEESRGSAVHFAEDGVEVLDANVYSESGESADTFAFTQESFSVTGTMLYARSTGETEEQDNVIMSVANDSFGMTHTSISDVTANNNKTYILYAKDRAGKCYAIDNDGRAVEITLKDGLIYGSNANTANIYWKFTRLGQQGDYAECSIRNNEGKYIHTFYNSNTHYGIVDGTEWPNTYLQKHNDGSFEVICNDRTDYIKLENGTFAQTEDSSKSVSFYLIEATHSYVVWFDGTAGGMMSLAGSQDEWRLVPSATQTAQFTVPSTWQSPQKYIYKIRGWYDIYSNTYYKAGETATVNRNTVFYPEWEPGTYDVGIENEHVVGRLDTNDFITTEVFDYNLLFNMYSNIPQSDSTLSNTAHHENWTMVNNGNVPYQNQRSLEFVFIDYDAGGDISYANNRRPNNENPWNQSLDNVTTGVIESVRTQSQGKNILSMLFDNNNAYDIDNKTGILGKTYLGQGNYLYQLRDDGYYYYDSKLNAASYNQSEQRFYVYDYLERTSDSLKDGKGNEEIGAFSDFLPFNSPYANIPAEQDWVNYNKEGYGEINTNDDLVNYPNYQYDAKDNKEESYADRIATNYWFGIKSSIRFYLPNDVGSKIGESYGNISTHGSQMEFKFSGDDDVWVFVDGQLLLDVGGMHGVRGGSINFSTGVVKDHNENFIRNFTLPAGEHTLTVYYMERGSSQSNCAIYFNIAPRYTLEISKEDIFNSQRLNGAQFTVYEDLACKSPAKLWNSYAEYASYPTNEVAEKNAKSTFTVVDGLVNIWGFAAGKTYYIKETAPPTDTGYPSVKGIICMNLSAHGDATYKVLVVDENGEITPGFEVLGFRIDEETQRAYMVVTNQKEEETTELKVTKKWHSSVSASNIPSEISVYLMRDGERVGREAILNSGNNWTHTWTGLPKYDENHNEIIYTVGEELVPGFKPTVTIKDPIDGVAQVEVLNTPISVNEQTFVKVNKVWSDGNSTHYRDSITVHLLADGADTGYELVLNRANNWEGIFDGIPIYQEDGETEIVYTVKEDEVLSYIPSYSDPVKITINKNGYSITVTNTYDYELPESGGIGANKFILGGGAFIAMAVLILIKSLFDRRCKYPTERK